MITVTSKIHTYSSHCLKHEEKNDVFGDSIFMTKWKQ